MEVYKPNCEGMGLDTGMITEAQVTAKFKKGGKFIEAMGDDIGVEGAIAHSRQAYELREGQAAVIDSFYATVSIFQVKSAGILFG